MRNPPGSLGITVQCHSVRQSYLNFFWNIHIVCCTCIKVSSDWMICVLMSHPKLYTDLLSFSAEFSKWLFLFYLHFIPSSFSCLQSFVFLTAFCHSLSLGGCNGGQRSKTKEQKDCTVDVKFDMLCMSNCPAPT